MAGSNSASNIDISDEFNYDDIEFDRYKKACSDMFDLTIWYQTAENHSHKISTAVVINSTNNRLRLLEDFLKTVKFRKRVTDLVVVCETERAYKKLEEFGVHCEVFNKCICVFYIAGVCRFGDKCFNSHEIVLDRNIPLFELSQKMRNEGAETRGNKPTITSSIQKEKKVPMKTATDVIHRIQWDQALKPEDFTVGYLDRFLGVVENCFTSFDWEDVTSLDDKLLIIPQHRIQYFKYLDQIVWDKRKRLDLVFGSTGSTVTIRDIIRQREQKEVTIPTHN